MVTVIDAEQWPAVARPARWQDVLCDLYTPLWFTPLGPAVRGRITVGEVDRLRVAHSIMGASTLRSRPVRGRAASPVTVVVSLTGSTTLRQGGRETHLMPGDLALIDPGRECTVLFAEDARSTTVSLPAGLLGLTLERVSAVSATRVAASDPAAAATVGMLKPLVDGLGVLTRRQEERVADALAHLLGASLTPLAEQLPQPDRVTRLRHSALDYVERHLSDPGLGPVTVAAAHHVSVRQLQRAFEEGGQTLTAVIRSRRLAAARAALADPARAEETITGIAVQYGMTDLAGFSRRFHAAFGVAPREFRRRCLGRSPEIAAS
ncbi:transcriptional regulator with only HTH domain, AraC family [Actinobacteria bacterium OK074]|nr:transcriptional regulator with only HTH domain, AraC family [Actinobacteria bacterium OK074]